MRHGIGGEGGWTGGGVGVRVRGNEGRGLGGGLGGWR